MSTPNHATDLLEIAARLSALLEREVALLRAARPAEIEDLQAEKATLTAAYESRAKAVHGDRVAGLQPALRAELEAAIGKLRTALAENERALRAARTTTQRVLQAIAEEIDRKRNENAGYAPAATGAAAAGNGARRPVSVAIDGRF